MNGYVYLVGAGPGDPGLLTVRGREVLEQCDVLVYDNLVLEAVINLVPASARRIYVGKEAGHHTFPQEEISALLVREARAGNRVVRLKGGDPFIFGRGSEECELLRANQIPFEVIPGVSATSAVPAYAGIPLTARNMATSFHVVTGHEHADKERNTVNWQAMARLDGTLVIFMGVTTLGSITEALIRYGRDPQTPAAAIRWGTTDQQKTLTATLATLADVVEQAQLRPPALIVIGNVVALRETLQWFQES